ncbi:GT2 family glycosyltransferase [Jatrophihabitans sp. GAS493]|uniref:glycosyltransferase family 2 protein n=1 Tax=Jatrophihabitans sp. GAS493 TaxID=1907575 RepID=UPI000BB78A3A|nr:glycosyltransferase family 2 protein [Jatrophihabitans sp. GAS493]SOD71285.1 GT2 family glycosyltransferase [Jatrophihabitans sp. GAS493]
MSRLPVSIVVPVWNAVEVTLQCLAALRPTLGPADQVIVVDDGSSDPTAAALAERADWLEVVTHPANLGFAAACNDGAALARHELVIFLNNDTIPSAGWIEDLTAPFVDDTIGAAGPMSNAVSGTQQVVDATGAPVVDAAAAEIVSDLRAREGASWSDVSRLVGFCLAVRTEAFRELGGFDLCYGQGGYEDDDLCTRMLLASWRLVMAESAFVYHQYHSTFDANGIDWYRVQQGNGELYRAKLDRAFPLSVLVRCDGDQLTLLQSLLSIQRSLGESRYEVVLLVTDPEPIAQLLAALEGDVVVVRVRPDDRSWRRGQHVATGLRRISMRAGDELSPEEVELVLAAPIGTQLQPVAA